MVLPGPSWSALKGFRSGYVWSGAGSGTAAAPSALERVRTQTRRAHNAAAGTERSFMYHLVRGIVTTLVSRVRPYRTRLRGLCLLRAREPSAPRGALAISSSRRALHGHVERLQLRLPLRRLLRLAPLLATRPPPD